MTKAGASMVSSMTGYGKSVYSKDSVTLEVEVKTLNNRYLDINIRLPRDYSEYEMKLREAVQKHFKRGRIDVQISRTVKEKTARNLRFNKPLYENLKKLYITEARKLKVLEEEFLQEALVDILGRKDVIEVSEAEVISPKKEKEILFRIFGEACEKTISTRRKEGARLLKDISDRFKTLEHCLKQISKLAAASADKIRVNIIAKIENLDVKALDRGRLEQEAALIALRSDISEELTRLTSHLRTLAGGIAGFDGKKLDFMLQEILREFNTIGAKSADARITSCVVTAKTEIERIKEQSQNVE